MSRSNKIIESPCKKFLQWESDNSEFSYWDKSLGEKGEKVKVPLPLRFAVLDELSTIKGYHEGDKSGIWSNEVRDIKTGILIPRTTKGVIVEGTYTLIKDEINAAGGKYTKSLYVAVINEDGEFEIQNLQLKGAAFSGWIEFTQKVGNKIYTQAIICHNFRSEKKGKVTYTVPEFKLDIISPDENEICQALDEDLQKYLKFYFNKNTDNTIIEKEKELVEDY